MTCFLPAPNHPYNDRSERAFKHRYHKQGRGHIRATARKANEPSSKNYYHRNAQRLPGEYSAHDWLHLQILHLVTLLLMSRAANPLAV